MWKNCFCFWCIQRYECSKSNFFVWQSYVCLSLLVWKSIRLQSDCIVWNYYDWIQVLLILYSSFELSMLICSCHMQSTYLGCMILLLRSNITNSSYLICYVLYKIEMWLTCLFFTFFLSPATALYNLHHISTISER